jgi:hypothetical protein
MKLGINSKTYIVNLTTGIDPWVYKEIGKKNIKLIII